MKQKKSLTERKEHINQLMRFGTLTKLSSKSEFFKWVQEVFGEHLLDHTLKF